MIIEQKALDNSFGLPIGISPEETVYFDIETTGFSADVGFSTLQNHIKLYKPQKCGIFLSNFLNFFVVWCCILIKSVI